jgi:hypothetical protein
MVLREVNQHGRKGGLGGVFADCNGPQLNGPLEPEYGDLHNWEFIAGGREFREAFTWLDVVFRIHAFSPQPETATGTGTLQAQDPLWENLHGLDELFPGDSHGPLTLSLPGNCSFKGKLHVCGLQDHFLGANVHKDVLKDGKGDPPVKGMLQETQRPVQTIFGNL